MTVESILNIERLQKQLHKIEAIIEHASLNKYSR